MDQNGSRCIAEERLGAVDGDEIGALGLQEAPAGLLHYERFDWDGQYSRPGATRRGEVNTS